MNHQTWRGVKAFDIHLQMGILRVSHHSLGLCESTVSFEPSLLLHCKGWSSSSHCHVHVPLVPETLQSPKTKFEDLCHINSSSWESETTSKAFDLWSDNTFGKKDSLCHVWSKKNGRTGEIRSDNQTSFGVLLPCLMSFVCLHECVCLERLVFPCVPNICFHCEWNIGRKMIHFGIGEKFWNQPDTVPTSHSKVAF